MKLDDAQKAKVIKWVEEGLKLSEIQNKLASELGVSMTYMELRFLIDDLGVKPQNKTAEPAPTEIKPEEKGAKPAPGIQPEGEEQEELGGGGVSVKVDQVTRPGALVSGKVTFSDGKSADWYLDQMGRLGVVPKEQGYKPSQQDVMDFQVELQNELARLGY